MTRRSVYSIDAGLPFARALAAGVVTLAGTPERLARGLIMVPSRRAAKALQTAFLDLSDGAAMLLPQMVPIGDLADDDEAGASLPNGDALPPRSAACGGRSIWQNCSAIFRLGGIIRPLHRR